jgi:clathrin heavy chain
MQITSTAVPEATDPGDVSVTVRAFINADLPLKLIELLEKIILESSAFSKNRYLQNLLMLTAIRAERGKVVDYTNHVTNYDYEEIAQTAKEHGLYEEALTAYKKYDNHALAINVLLEDIVSIDRAVDFATKVDKPEVWSWLAKAQLDGLHIKDVIGKSTFARSNPLLTSTQSRTSRLQDWRSFKFC